MEQKQLNTPPNHTPCHIYIYMINFPPDLPFHLSDHKLKCSVHSRIYKSEITGNKIFIKKIT